MAARNALAGTAVAELAIFIAVAQADSSHERWALLAFAALVGVIGLMVTTSFAYGVPFPMKDDPVKRTIDENFDFDALIVECRPPAGQHIEVKDAVFRYRRKVSD